MKLTRFSQVVVSFWIEAFLTTAFLFGSWAENFHSRLLRAPASHARILNALRAVLPTFYWSSVLLSLGVTVASLSTVLDTNGLETDDSIDQWKDGKTLYLFDTYLATLASILSTLPPFMGGLMLQMPGRRR